MASWDILALTDDEQQKLYTKLGQHTPQMGISTGLDQRYYDLQVYEDRYTQTLNSPRAFDARAKARVKEQYEDSRGDFLEELVRSFERWKGVTVPDEERTRSGEQLFWLTKFLSRGDIYGAAGTYAYTASMLTPKSDQLGRHALIDIHAKLTTNVEWRNYLYLAGSTNHLMTRSKTTGVNLGAGYTHDHEQAQVAGRGVIWHRAHSPGEVSYKASAIDSGPGLGFVLYCGAALISRIFYGAAGCYSTGERVSGNIPGAVWPLCQGNYRSDDATAFWKRQVDRGFAKKLLGMMRTDCTSPFIAETINADDVLKTGFVVFLVQPDNSPAAAYGVAVGAAQTPGFNVKAEDSFTTNASSPGGYADTLFSGRKDEIIALGQKYGIYFKDGRPTYPLPQRGIKQKASMRLELLTRCYHGESPLLMFTIMEMLALADTTAAVDYATRPDVARMLAKSAPARKLLTRLQQRRVAGVDGLAGLSDYELGEIVQAVTYAGAGRMPIDLDADNPLHFAPLSAETRRELAKYGD